VFRISIKAPSPRVLHGKECNEKRENPIGETGWRKEEMKNNNLL
jgi:hypothetical protein